MAVIKRKAAGQYLHIGFYPLKDKRLSASDLGVLVKLLSLPDEWQFTLAGLSCIFSDGKSALRSSFQRLEELGYVKRERERTASGELGDMILYVTENPTSLPVSDFPTLDNRTLENPTLDFRTQSNNKQDTIKESTINVCNTPPSKSQKRVWKSGIHFSEERKYSPEWFAEFERKNEEMLLARCREEHGDKDE